MPKDWVLLSPAPSGRCCALLPAVIVAGFSSIRDNSEICGRTARGDVRLACLRESRRKAACGGDAAFHSRTSGTVAAHYGSHGSAQARQVRTGRFQGRASLPDRRAHSALQMTAGRTAPDTARLQRCAARLQCPGRGEGRCDRIRGLLREAASTMRRIRPGSPHASRQPRPTIAHRMRCLTTEPHHERTDQAGRAPVLHRG